MAGSPPKSNNHPLRDSESASDRAPVSEADATPPSLLSGNAIRNDNPDGVAAALWATCREILKAQVSPNEFTTWIRPLQCYHTDNRLWLCAPNRFVVDKIEKSYRPMIEAVVAQCSGKPSTDIKVTVGQAADLEATANQSTEPRRSRVRGRTSESVVEKAQFDLFQMERQGQFVAVPITSKNEFPTLLTRLPIFVPGRASKQRDLLDREYALAFETSWGMGRKFGPPLTVYDEDTLMALGRLRQNMLIGDPSKMPHPVSKLYATRDDPAVHVHVVLCMLTDIQRMCGTSSGGRNNKLRLASVRRLAATKIEFSKETQNKIDSTGTTIDLIHVKWDEYEENAILYVQFSPIMAAWLERAFTYVDWNIRRKLRSDVGKAVHRFLSGQRKNYQIFAKKLQETVGHTGSYKYFMHDLRGALKQLAELGWLKSFEITGNGRKHPHKVVISR